MNSFFILALWNVSKLRFSLIVYLKKVWCFCFLWGAFHRTSADFFAQFARRQKNMEIVLCLLILSISILVFYYFFNLEDNKVQPSVAEVQPKKVKKVVVEPKNFESVTILSCLGQSNTCIAIFKNPWSHKTHFYRTRLKGKWKLLNFDIFLN